MPARIRVFSLCLILVSCCTGMHAQHTANANTYYQQLRGLMPGHDVISVSNLVLRRDAATFTLQQGNIAFYGAVNGKVTGAVYKGNGHLHITPPNAQERHNLSIFNHTEEFDEDFDELVLRFTDDTAAELHKYSTGAGAPGSAYKNAAEELQSFARHHLYENLDLRLLQDVLSPDPGGYFLAAIHGVKNNHLFYLLDPNGVTRLAPEEVALENWKWGDDTVTYPLAFHRAAEYANGTPSGNEHNAAYKILNEDLDVMIEYSGFLSCLATVEVRAEQDGVAVIPLDLHSDRDSSLNVSRVETGKGEPLDYVQEKKDEDPDFGVILAQPLKKGETATLKIAYGGKNVVINEGNGNYYPTARGDWYPNSYQGLGDYATYHMIFHVPKGLQMVATGTKIGEKTEGKVTTTEWKTDVPLPVVGFSVGDFKMQEAKIGDKQGDNLIVDAYANNMPPDAFTRHDNAPSVFESKSQSDDVLGTFSTAALLPVELSQSQVAARVYTSYFGPLPFARVAVTQQSACFYGQSWPMLVYLPICAFFDTTTQHFMGLGGENLNKHMYWKVVTPHEMAHQWWGQTVGFRSYRDQWMSEGFADASASIFLQATRPKPDDFINFWKEEHRILTEKNQFGFRAVDVGPVTMGYRLSSPKAGWNIYGDLVYPKGAYILHMIRMMMWTPKEGDDRFKAMMHDFVNTYRFQAATTEDFKAMVEKHMSPAMDLDGNRKMDWFFNEYVYGTDLPTYHFDGDVKQTDSGTTLHFKLVQSGVPSDFKMLVPMYLEYTDGKIMRLGALNITGSSTLDQTVNLPKLPSQVKRVSINHYYDVLAAEN
jgi:hypothetical protein